MPDNLYSMPRLKSHQSITRLLAILTGSVFIVELLVMFLLDVLPPMPPMASFLLDSTLLSALIFPIFYFLVFRPQLHDIAELREAADNLRVASAAFESKGPILITDAHANILRVNKMFLNITGYTLEELIGQNPRIFQSGRYGKEFYSIMWSQLIRTGSWSGRIRIKDKRGNSIPVETIITAIKNEQQETTHYVAIYNL